MDRLESTWEFRELAAWLELSREPRAYSEEVADDLIEELLYCHKRETVDNIFKIYQNLTTIISWLSIEEQEVLVEYFRQQRQQLIEGELQ